MVVRVIFNFGINQKMIKGYMDINREYDNGDEQGRTKNKIDLRTEE